jgi:ferrochelatase
MRNWDPYLRDTVAEMSRRGVRRAIGVIAAAHRSYSSCAQYRENVADARRALREANLPDVEITYVDDWYLSAGFIEANAHRILAALDSLPAGARADAEIVFTAHSIPTSMAERYPYQRQLEETCAAVAAALTSRIPHPAPRIPDPASRPWRLVFQSRSGRPEDSWLEPDVCDALGDVSRSGASGAVLCPIGFVCDHIEVLYDLDVEARDAATRLGLPLARAAAVNDDPHFIAALAGAVLSTVARYAHGRPLPLVPAPAAYRPDFATATIPRG